MDEASLITVILNCSKYDRDLLHSVVMDAIANADMQLVTCRWNVFKIEVGRPRNHVLQIEDAKCVVLIRTLLDNIEEEVRDFRLDNWCRDIGSSFNYWWIT